MAMKKGFFYSFDALLASILIVAAVLGYLAIEANTLDRTAGQLFGQDVLLSLEELKLYELQTDYPVLYANLISNETFALTGNESLTYVMGVLWVFDVERDEKYDDIYTALDDIVPPKASVNLTVDGETIWNKTGAPTKKVLSVANQQISGIEPSKPVAGTSSTAYIKRLRGKQTSSFTYFGGFVGQGIINVTLELPSDATLSYFGAELDTPGTFDVYVDGMLCDSGNAPSHPEQGVPDTYDWTATCMPLISGDAEISINFTDLDDAFIAGGYLKATYTTEVLRTDYPTSETIYNFSGIEGIVNLYDAIIIPETVTAIDAYIHYGIYKEEEDDPPFISYLTFGEWTIFENPNEDEQFITLDTENFTDAGVILEAISNTTVPLRFAAFNASWEEVYGGNATVVLVTDYSGSMKAAIDNNSQLGDQSGDMEDCEGTVYDLLHVRRTELARCLGQEVVNTLLGGVVGNKMWSVQFFNDEVFKYTNDQSGLIQHFQKDANPPQGFKQVAKGGTCIACALSEAYLIFQDEENAGIDRDKYIIFMSDGVPNYCTASDCLDTIDTEYASNPVPGCGEGYCDASGICDEDDIVGCSDGLCDAAGNNALNITQKLIDDFDTTIFSIGFGPVYTCNYGEYILRTMAERSGGAYNGSDNVSVLLEIYQNFSERIVSQLELDEQKVVVEGNFSNSILYKDSYIRITHDEAFGDARPNEIEITMQSDPFSAYTGSPYCHPFIDLPSSVRYRDVTATSYSGQNWTKTLRVNDNLSFNLSDWAVNYSRIGDPYRIGVPVEYFQNETTLEVDPNPVEFRMEVGKDSDTNQGCSGYNSLIYTVFVPSATSRTDPLPKADGCLWNISLDQGGDYEVPVPATYSGPNKCYYRNNSGIPPEGSIFDDEDTIQLAVHNLLEKLDFDNDHRIFLALESESLEIIVTPVSGVPYLWGPVLVQVVVEQ